MVPPSSVRPEAVADTFEPASSAAEAVVRLDALYARSVEALRAALKTYLDGGSPPGGADRASGMFAYPELRITYRPDGPVPPAQPGLRQVLRKWHLHADHHPSGAVPRLSDRADFPASGRI